MVLQNLWKALFILIFVSALGIFLFTTLEVEGLIKQGIGYLDSQGPVAGFIFVVFMVLAPFLFVPVSLLSMGAGFLFGFIPGTLITVIATVLCSVLGFVIGRYFMREWVIEKAKHNRKFTILDHAVQREGWKVVALFRIVPLMPFTAMNCFLGLTKISLRHYIIASFLAMLPGLAALVFFGSIAGDFTALKERYSLSPEQWTATGAVFILAIGIAGYWIRRAYYLIEHKFE